MAGFSFDHFSAALQETQKSGVSFESKALKWENEEEAKELIEAINNCPKLQFLNLAGNTLGVNAAKGIGDALAKHPEFQEALFKDLFTGRMKTEIPIALKHLGRGTIQAGAHLTVLDCSDNALGPNGMAGLVDWIKSSACFSLEKLLLNNCGLGITGGKMLAKALLDCHEAGTKAGTPLKLKVFIAGRNRLENDGAKALAEVFQAIGTLEEVAMPQNGIYHIGISALSEAFKENPNMKILNLNDNTISPKGAIALASAFEYMQKLEYINFGDCLLKTAGAVHIGEALQDGHLLLETLNLGFNEIGPNGGLLIASAMSNKDHLQSLNLNGNQFATEAREQILELLTEFRREGALDEMDEDDSDAAEEEEDENENGDDEDSDGESDDGEEDDLTYQTVADYTTQCNSTNGSLTNELDVTGSTLNNSSVDDIQRPNTVETFCNTPTPSEVMFNSLLDEDKVTAFQTYFKTLSEKDFLSHLVFATLKCAAISSKNPEALKVAIALLKDCYDHATKTNQVLHVNNFFLIQLGLIKAEEKTFKPCYDLKACRSVLKSAIGEKAIPAEAATTFNFFLQALPLEGGR